MKTKIVLLLALISCTHRSDEKMVAQKLQLIIGEPVTCLQTYQGEGFLCKSESKKNYFCPYDADSQCFFTPRLKLEEPLAEKLTGSN